MANSKAADAALALLEKAEAAAYKTYKTAYDQWKKKDTAQTYLAMSNAMTSYATASAATDQAQAKADAASNAVIVVLTTWPEYTEYTKLKGSVTLALANHKAAVQKLEAARKQVDTIRAQLQKARDDLSKLKGTN